jgi:hypothetical protein
MTDRPWFTYKNFTTLEILKNKSLADHTVVKAVTITDPKYIRKLAEKIEQIPPDGDMMISFSGAAEHIELRRSTPPKTIHHQSQWSDRPHLSFKRREAHLSGFLPGSVTLQS